MASIFDILTLADAQKVLGTVRLSEGDREALDFARGDYWRGGEGWVGQKPPPGEQYRLQIAAIAAGFIAKGVTGEIVARHRAGVLGREPRWSFVPRRPLGKDADGRPLPPTAEELALIGEAEAALTVWWDKRRPLPTLHGALDRALLIGRAPLRLVVAGAPAEQQGDGRRRLRLVPREGQTALAAALDTLHLDAPDPETCGTFTDPATRREVGIFAFRAQPDDRPFAALLAGKETGPDAAELSYLDDADATIGRVATAGGTGDVSDPLDLGGRILMRDLAREALITPQIRQMQKALNLDLTQMVRNVNLAGSLERIFVNVKPPGRTVDAAGQPWVEGVSTGDPRFIPEPLPSGAAVSAFLRGFEVKDAQGALTGYSNGTVNYREPVDVTTFTETDNAFVAGMLEEAHQLHALISKDATASGESRKQARAEFAESLNTSKVAVDEQGRWLLETALALAAALAGTPGRFESLRCEFGCVVDAGPLTADERQQIVAEFTAGLTSRETAMALLGTDDVDAELARIKAEQAEKDARAAEIAARQPAALPPGQQGDGQGDGGRQAA